MPRALRAPKILRKVKIRMLRWQQTGLHARGMVAVQAVGVFDMSEEKRA